MLNRSLQLTPRVPMDFDTKRLKWCAECKSMQGLSFSEAGESCKQCETLLTEGPAGFSFSGVWYLDSCPQCERQTASQTNRAHTRAECCFCDAIVCSDCGVPTKLARSPVVSWWCGAACSIGAYDYCSEMEEQHAKRKMKLPYASRSLGNKGRRKMMPACSTSILCKRMSCAA